MKFKLLANSVQFMYNKYIFHITKKYQIHEHYLTKNAYVYNSPLNNSPHVHKIRITSPETEKANKGESRGE